MTEPVFQSVAIVGAGAIGGWLGVALAQAGHPVSMVARGDTLRALQAEGLRMRRADGTLAQVPVTAHSDPTALGVQDLVVVAVKAPGLPDVARAMAPLIGPDTIVLTAMNGVPWWFLDGFGGAAQGRALESVDAGGVIAQAIPARNVVGSVVHTSCSLEAPGFVKQHFGNRLIVGEPDGSQSARRQALADTLQRGGIDVEVSSCIQKDIWFKLWGNLTMNPISALTGATTDRILDDELVRGFISNVMLEAKAIGEREAVGARTDALGARGMPERGGRGDGGRLAPRQANGGARPSQSRRSLGKLPAASSDMVAMAASQSLEMGRLARVAFFVIRRLLLMPRDCASAAMSCASNSHAAKGPVQPS